MIEDRDLDARLENWARVYRDRPNRRSQPSVIVRLIALYGEPDPKAYWRTAEMPDETRPPKDETDAALIERYAHHFSQSDTGLSSVVFISTRKLLSAGSGGSLGLGIKPSEKGVGGLKSPFKIF